MDFFDKPMSSYKTGFGDTDSDYWIGLDTLHNLTTNYDWKLQVRNVYYYEGRNTRALLIPTFIYLFRTRFTHFIKCIKIKRH